MITAVQNKQQAFERIQSHQSTLKQFGAARLGLFYFPFTEWNDASDIQLIVKFEEGVRTFTHSWI